MWNSDTLFSKRQPLFPLALDLKDGQIKPLGKPESIPNFSNYQTNLIFPLSDFPWESHIMLTWDAYIGKRCEKMDDPSSDYDSRDHRNSGAFFSNSCAREREDEHKEWINHFQKHIKRALK